MTVKARTAVWAHKVFLARVLSLPELPEIKDEKKHTMTVLIVPWMYVNRAQNLQLVGVDGNDGLVGWDMFDEFDVDYSDEQG